MAGLSSMDLAITREPALQQKKKSPDRMRKAPHISNTVNALIDPIDEVGKTTSQLKVSCVSMHGSSDIRTYIHTNMYMYRMFIVCSCVEM